MPIALGTGRMDRRVTLQSATMSIDPITNQEIAGWSAMADVWAERLPIAAHEVWQARQIDATIEVIYRLHYRDDLTPEGTRILDMDGRLYDVKGITEIGRRQGLMVAVSARGEAP